MTIARTVVIRLETDTGEHCEYDWLDGASSAAHGVTHAMLGRFAADIWVRDPTAAEVAAGATPHIAVSPTGVITRVTVTRNGATEVYQ